MNTEKINAVSAFIASFVEMITVFFGAEPDTVQVVKRIPFGFLHKYADGTYEAVITRLVNNNILHTGYKLHREVQKFAFDCGDARFTEHGFEADAMTVKIIMKLP